MNILALSLAVNLSLTSLGVAAWTCWALSGASGLEIDFGRFEGRQFE